VANGSQFFLTSMPTWLPRDRRPRLSGLPFATRLVLLVVFRVRIESVLFDEAFTDDHVQARVALSLARLLVVPLPLSLLLKVLLLVLVTDRSRTVLLVLLELRLSNRLLPSRVSNRLVRTATYKLLQQSVNDI
jgi:hypothetical protein